MSSRTCPDWPRLMEIAPDLQFKHYTVAETRLPGEVLMKIPDVALAEVAICCDLEHHVFYAAHTDPQVAEALRSTHWFEVHEWSQRGPGSG
ncbi:MAG: hypothetical protein E6G08_04970 [Actinobacteria bacterium]|nr:MAG: hypothetical protein E6G08_04970 [Actinomycetota bacterium]